MNKNIPDFSPGIFGVLRWKNNLKKKETPWALFERTSINLTCSTHPFSFRPLHLIFGADTRYLCYLHSDLFKLLYSIKQEQILEMAFVLSYEWNRLLHDTSQWCSGALSFPSFFWLLSTNGSGFTVRRVNLTDVMIKSCLDFPARTSEKVNYTSCNRTDFPHVLFYICWRPSEYKRSLICQWEFCSGAWWLVDWHWINTPLAPFMCTHTHAHMGETQVSYCLRMWKTNTMPEGLNLNVFI